MLPRKLTNLVSLVLIIAIIETSATRTRDKIYETIVGTSACFRRLNGTHQFGCASLRKGSVGVLQMVTSSDDLQWLLDKAPAEPYMPILRPEMFTRSVLLSLKKSTKVNGVVLLKQKEDTSSTLSNFSPEDTCPNRYSGLATYDSPYCDDEKPWNRDGTSLMEVDWGFPIFVIVNDSSIEKIVNCSTKYNSERDGQETRSLCAIEMKSFMFAAKDSETCIRRSGMMNNLNPVKYCDPLGDKNIWATIFPRNKEEPEKNNTVIMLAAKLDSTSMFDGEVMGAGSTIGGLVSVLATAQMLTSIKPEMRALSKGRNVMITLLNGESHDYIGSSRMVFDMKQANFPLQSTGVQPLNMSNIRLMIELNQVSNLNITGPQNFAKIFFHPTPSNTLSPEVVQFMNLMKNESINSQIDFLPSSVNKLPPVSLQSFVKGDPMFPGVAITDYDDHFANRFYHSIMDDADVLKYKYLNHSEAPPNSVQAHLARLSTALAKSIYQMTTDQAYVGTEFVDPMLIDELLHCYLETFNCSIFQAVTKEGDILPDYSPSMYVGVANQTNFVTRLTANTLAFFTGNKLVNVTKENCKITNKTDYTYMYLWMRGSDTANDSMSACYQSTVNYTQAVSPAFILPNYKWKSGEYSTWTESVWNEFNVRIFLKPSTGHEIYVISLGSIVLVISFIVIWFISSRSDILFNTNTLNGGC